MAIKHSTGVTWALLVLLTLLSYFSWVDADYLDFRISGSFVIVVALLKAWLIGMRFMELGRAIAPLRLAYNLWLVVVGAILLAMFW